MGNAIVAATRVFGNKSRDARAHVSKSQASNKVFTFLSKNIKNHNIDYHKKNEKQTKLSKS